ncbi:hypothetical protein AB1Y20_008888 [Prymnesium parvum]|uniref:Protein xylosyltransferase n=1 Tax=Prymnesium parvum TaxID=97485 RepID=A0AB34ISY1_PRYPA
MPSCSSHGLVLLSSMQWLYGPTWAPSLNLCSRAASPSCVGWAEVHARQAELAEVLRRNLAHAAVAEVHLLLGEVPPVRKFLHAMPWGRARCLTLVAIKARPRFSHYLSYMSTALLGRTVVLTNQDVFLTSGWASLSLPPSSAFLLSRHHSSISYDPSAARAYLNATPARAAACDMASRGVWARSLCGPRNFGSYDAYVLRLEAPLGGSVLSLLDYPQNAWGGENVFQFVLQEAMGLRTSNPCHSLQVMHMHCELPTTFSAPKVGDRRLGKREVAQAVLRKMRAMGKHVTMDAAAIGSLTLNSTYA